MRRIGALMNLAADDAGKWPGQTLKRHRTPGVATAGPHLAFGLSTGSGNPYHSRQFGVHPGNAG
jgi:hypothetical protein